ncbi:MAG: hypothetical protein AAGA31_08570 [Bacteroidota bacterium]
MGTVTPYVPKLTIDRWYEDRLEQLGLTEEEAIKRFFDKYNVGKYMLTTLFKTPQKARIEHLRAMVDVLELHNNWYAELVETFGFGIKGISLDEYNSILAQDGLTLGLVHNVAA